MKLVLAHCGKKDRHFCLEVDDRSGERVTNFIEVTASEKTAIPASAANGELITADNLVPCGRCGTRRVGSCKCSEKSERCKNGSYNFGCLYCRHLELERALIDPVIYVSSPRFDDIGQVLDGMKLKYKPYKGKFDCDLLFINCGTSDNFDPQKLSEFVYKGGCVYISDQASSILSQAFPGILSFSNSGNAGKLDADVIDPELESIAGKSIRVEFDLGLWSVITDDSGLGGVNGRVLLRASQDSAYSGKPLMVSFKHGSGTVFYTCFHNHMQASEKEKMLLQLLLLKQLGASSNQSVQQIGSLVGLNIDLMKEKFKG